MGQGPAGVNNHPPEAPDPDRLQRDIQSIRGTIGGLMRELNARRRQAMDVRLQFRKHPLVAVAASVAVVGLVAGGIALAVAHRRRERTLRARLRRLRQALRRMVDDPERIAPPQPGVGRKMLTAGGAAASSVIARRVAQRLFARNADE